MHILRVIPIASGLPENVFTYFAKSDVSAGSLVEIKIRNRRLAGLVISSKNILEEKMDIKNSSFVLKKIESVLQNNFLSNDFLTSLNNVSTLLGTNVSNLVSTFTLKDSLATLVENEQKETLSLPIDMKEKRIFKEDIKNFNKNKIIIDNLSGRLKVYKNIIRESLAKKESLVLYFSTINELESACTEIEKGIEKYCISLHSDLPSKILKENLERLNKENAPLIILSTPSIIPFFISEKINLQNVILEKENSYYYFTHNARCQLDSRVMIKNLSNDMHLNLMFGSELPSLETYLDFKNKKIEEFYKNTFNTVDEYGENIKQNNVRMIDMTKKKSNSDLPQPFQRKGETQDTKYDKVYFAKEIIEELEKIKNKNEGHAFIYTKRKGLYTETACNDCNTIFKCEDCEKPFVLFNEKLRIYVCPSCKKKVELKGEQELICKNCLSWNMRPLGIATEGIAKNLEECGFKTFILDSQNVKTKRQAKKIIKDWQKEKSGILIGTELAINFLTPEMDISFILAASMDSFFSIPEINIDEKILNIVIDLKDKLKWQETEKNKSKNNLYIETRLPDAPVWRYVSEQNYLKFLDEELLTRKELTLPPFVHILKITLDKKNENIKEYIEKVFQEETENGGLEIIWHKEKRTGSYIGIVLTPKKLWQETEEENHITPTIFSKKIVQLLTNFKLEINAPNLYS